MGGSEDLAQNAEEDGSKGIEEVELNQDLTEFPMTVNVVNSLYEPNRYESYQQECPNC